MIKHLLHYSFLLPSVAFLVHQITQKIIGFSFPFIDNYLDPFCFGALVPPLLLMERKLIFNELAYSKLEILVLLTILVIFSEVLLPFIDTRFIADPIDACLIVLGGGWYWRLGNPSIFLLHD
jgi:hypothetical protein